MSKTTNFDYVIVGGGEFDSALALSQWRAGLEVGTSFGCRMHRGVKPDSTTAATALEAGPLLKEAGLPDGVFNVVLS